MAQAGVDVALLAATASLPPPGQSLSAFIAALDGQTVDSCGGFPAGQCTALACAWCRNLGLGTPCGSCAAPNHCDGLCWQGGGFAGWTWIVNTPSAVPSPGDLVCYRPCAADGIGASGHVDIFVSGTASSFTSFAQNWAGAFCKLVTHGYECVVGWHHPTGSPTPHPTPTPVPVPPPPAPLGLLESPVGAGLVLLGAGGLFWYLRERRGPAPRHRVAPTGGFGFRGAGPRRRSASAPARRSGGFTRTRDATLEERAVAQLGTVSELSDASFVLPDGTLLAWPRGTGPIRTRESGKHHPDLAQDLTGSTKLEPLLDDGWMRVQNFRDVLVTTVGQPITPAQAARLRDGARPFAKLVMEAEYGAALDRPHCEATPPAPGTVNACVRDLNSGIVEGRAKREALLARIRRDHPELLR